MKSFRDEKINQSIENGVCTSVSVAYGIHAGLHIFLPMHPLVAATKAGLIVFSLKYGKEKLSLSSSQNAFNHSAITAGFATGGTFLGWGAVRSLGEYMWDHNLTTSWIKRRCLQIALTSGVVAAGSTFFAKKVLEKRHLQQSSVHADAARIGLPKP